MFVQRQSDSSPRMRLCHANVSCRCVMRMCHIIQHISSLSGHPSHFFFWHTSSSNRLILHLQSRDFPQDFLPISSVHAACRNSTALGQNFLLRFLQRLDCLKKLTSLSNSPNLPYYLQFLFIANCKPGWGASI